MAYLQDKVHQFSLREIETFWMRQAKELFWHKQPSRALQTRTKKLKSGAAYLHWTWFADGEISTCYNCIDRHVEAGHGSSTAIIWDSPVTAQKEQYTYRQLLDEVEALAAVLQVYGVKKGDVVLIYSMIQSFHGDTLHFD